MAIHFISGKPRGGKSLYAVRLIVDELLHGQRTIITNLPLKLGALNEYLQKKYPDRSIDVLQRIWILTDDETRHFWSYRPGCRIPILTDQQWRAGETPSYSAVKDNGVLYAIDEIHNFFNARAWAETGRDVLFYLSQHGKLSDTVICITQAITNVDKQFRSVAQDFTYLRNLSKEKMGLFKLPGVFIRKTYAQPATDTSHPMESGTFRLDVSGLASCYDTAQGVGIHGRTADKGEKKRGVHWSVGVVGLPLLVMAALHYGPIYLARATGADVPLRNIANTAPIQVPAGYAAGPAAPPGPRVQTTAVEVNSQTSKHTSILPTPPAPVKVVGQAVMGPKCWIVLSDGRLLNQDDGLRALPNGKIFIPNEAINP